MSKDYGGGKGGKLRDSPEGQVVPGLEVGVCLLFLRKSKMVSMAGAEEGEQEMKPQWHLGARVSKVLLVIVTTSAFPLREKRAIGGL